MLLIGASNDPMASISVRPENLSKTRSNEVFTPFSHIVQATKTKPAVCAQPTMSLASPALGV
jgi:hypothetical protein